MDKWSPFMPYLLLAVICGSASVGIVLIAMIALAHGAISDGGMLAIAAMAFAPAALGVGIAANMPRNHD